MLKFNLLFIIYLLAVVTSIAFTLQPTGAASWAAKVEKFVHLNTIWLNLFHLFVFKCFPRAQFTLFLVCLTLNWWCSVSVFYFSYMVGVKFQSCCAVPTTLFPEGCVDGSKSEIMLKFWLYFRGLRGACKTYLGRNSEGHQNIYESKKKVSHEKYLLYFFNANTGSLKQCVSTRCTCFSKWVNCRSDYRSVVNHRMRVESLMCLLFRADLLQEWS